MSIWSDMSMIVSATLSGDITFKTVQAYRSEGSGELGPVATQIRSLYKELIKEDTI